MGEPLWKTAWQFLRRLNLDPLDGSAVLHVGIFPTEVTTGSEDMPAHRCSRQLSSQQPRGRKPPNVRGDWINKAWFVLAMEWYSLNIRGLPVSGVLLGHRKEGSSRSGYTEDALLC